MYRYEFEDIRELDLPFTFYFGKLSYKQMLYEYWKFV